MSDDPLEAPQCNVQDIKTNESISRPPEQALTDGSIYSASKIQPSLNEDAAKSEVASLTNVTALPVVDGTTVVSPPGSERPTLENPVQAVKFLLRTNPEEIERAEAMKSAQADRYATDMEMTDVERRIGERLSAVKQSLGNTRVACVVGIARNAITAAIPAPVTSVVGFTGQKISFVGSIAANVITNAPELVVNTIPDALMSRETKQLVFVEFAGVIRPFFHTNVLLMPYVFRELGVTGAFIIMSFFSLLLQYSTEAFLKAKAVTAEPGRIIMYGDIPREILGDYYPIFNIVSNIIQVAGFQVFASRNMQVMIEMLLGRQINEHTFLTSLLATTLLAMPFMILKQAHHQRPLAILSNFFVGLSCLILLFYFPYNAYPLRYGPHNQWHAFSSVAICIYIVCGIEKSVPIESSMGLERYIRLQRIATALAYFMLVWFGVSGYTSYGDTTCSVLSLSFPKGRTSAALSVMIFVASIAALPQYVFPLGELIDLRLLGRRTVPSLMDASANIFRLLAIIICSLIAYLVPMYGAISAFCGISAAILGLFIPGLIDRVRRQQLHASLRLWDICIVVCCIGFGVIVSLCGAIGGIYTLVEFNNKTTKACV